MNLDAYRDENKAARGPEGLEAVFSAKEAERVRRIIALALDEDGEDLAGRGIFSADDSAEASITAREQTIAAGLVLIGPIFDAMGVPRGTYSIALPHEDGDQIEENETAAVIRGRTADLHRAGRVILNFICHMSGVASLTARYARMLDGTGVRLEDTRKTTPGHRCLEKYAVRMGGGFSGAADLAESLAVMSSYIDAAGGITRAVAILREKYGEACPPVTVQCRSEAEVREAVACAPKRILLGDMDVPMLDLLLPLIPAEIEAEVSGGVSLNTIRPLAAAGGTRHADFISVGRITHSAPVSNFSMRITRNA